MTERPKKKTAYPTAEAVLIDAMLEGRGRKLWGLPAIAQALGVCVDTARAWAKKDTVPIYQPDGSGQYFAFHGELMAWLRGKG